MGLALARRGAPPALAFDVAVRAVREHLRTVRQWVADALPGCPQIVVIDEPGFSGVMEPGFPIPPDTAIDLTSGALAAIEQQAVMGVHCCAEGDWAAVAATGPTILSVPADVALVDVAGHLSSFLDAGGWIAWGAVPTDRPVATRVRSLPAGPLRAVGRARRSRAATPPGCATRPSSRRPVGWRSTTRPRPRSSCA